VSAMTLIIIELVFVSANTGSSTVCLERDECQAVHRVLSKRHAMLPSVPL
jgi:hypothetical protein